MNYEAIKNDVTRYGWSKAMYVLALRGASRASVRIFKVVGATRIEAEFLEVSQGFQHRFLDRADLERFARDPQNRFEPSFVGEALGRGDRCYAILDGDGLAAYGWYGTATTPVGDDLAVSISPNDVFMYRGYTLPQYRGRRFHAIAMTWALRRYLEEGKAQMISYVDSINLSSLKSCQRMGYKHIGDVYIGKVGGHRIVYTDHACRKHAFRMHVV
jgi:GNAT superfamily N-acetyltransferase